jgi:fructosamine-3-kinase
VTVRIHPKYVKANDHVTLWDVGPVRPVAPVAPEAPAQSKDLKGADLALAQIHYEDALEDYKLALRSYGAAKIEHSKWHQANGGPLKVEQWSTDAAHALTVDPQRYFLELPKGMKPGKAQAEADRVAEMSEAELSEARDKDPQFGKGTQR